MTRTRLLGIDHGKARVGLAVSDPNRKIAFPLEVRARLSMELDAVFFRELCEREEIGGLVVGLPIHLSGQEGPAAIEARAYGKWLSGQTALPVVYYDERFSTVQAESALWDAGLTHKRRKQRRDKVAAQILLQAYLDAGCPTEPTAGPLDGSEPT